MAAILDGVKNVVAAKAAAAAGDYIRFLGSAASGGRSGDWRDKMNRPGKASNRREAGSKFTTENLTYPLNVEGDPQQGHFIMFMINVQDDAILKAQKDIRRLQNVINELADLDLEGFAGGSLDTAMTELDEKTRKIKNLVGYDPVFKEADFNCTHYTAPFKEQCADVIIAGGSVNWGDGDDIAFILDKLKSWLKPGGRLFMRGAPGGYDNDAGLDWFVWSAKDIHYYADLLDFKLIGDIKIEFNEKGTLNTRKMPHRYVWCYGRPNE